ncbi:MAG: RHS repeat protein [Clostridia bacterium]|nr:RHS repeat protein [Clostridia bacterium]
MKRFFLAICILLGVLLTSCATSPPMELVRKSVISYENGAEKVRFVYEYTYDSEGKLVSESHFSGENEKIYDLFFSYDEHGRCVSAEAKKAEGASVVYQGTVGWEYDEQGRVTALISETGRVMEYTYDEDGRVTRRASCGTTSRDDYFKWEEYEFLPDGVIQKEAWCNGWEAPSVKLCRETRDEEGRAILREYMRESERQVYRKNFFEYDGKGWIVRVENWSGADEFSEVTPKSELLLTYDDAGRLLNVLTRDLNTSEPINEYRYEYREIAPSADFSPSHFEKQQEEILDNLLDFKLKFF